MKYLLGIDIGTSATKTVLFDKNGASVADAAFDYPLYQPQNGWAEQDPEDWWNAVAKGIKAVVKKSKIDAADIAGIGLSGQMHGLVMLDKDNNVIRKSIIWCDQRTAKECAQITKAAGAKRLIEITANPALTGFTASKIIWVKNNEKENYKKCAHILLPKDYIRFKLTGEYATEVSDASGMQLLDVPKRKWSKEICEKLAIDMKLLAKVYESHEVTGKVTPQAAETTGLKAGTIVVGGAGDQAAAAIGNGIVEEGLISDTLGTSGVVFAHTNKPVIDPKGRVHTFCHAVKGCWHIMGVTQSAGLSLKWYKDNFFTGEKAQADIDKTDVYDIILKEAEKIKIGSEKLIYLPYLMGERTPHLDADARGVLFGLSAIHNKYTILRAVVEGISFSQKDCLSIINSMGVTASEVRVGGGGSRSEFWRSMLADIFNVPVATVNNKEGGALGVAILAGVGAGLYNDVVSACKKLIKNSTVVKPDKKNAAEYVKYYKLYGSLYKRLKGDFKKLSRGK